MTDTITSTPLSSQSTTIYASLTSYAEVPSKKKKCSLLEDASEWVAKFRRTVNNTILYPFISARSECYSAYDVSAPEIICSQEELRDTQLRRLCSNYQDYTSTTEAPTTIKQNNGCRK